MRATMEINDKECGYVSMGAFIGTASIRMIKALMETKGKKNLREDITDANGRKLGEWRVEVG